ncbi:hypothetical protein FXW07_06065 [Methanosarcina sp. DH1]|nr:hypothetical protein [Methanosarcina sp. DH1]MCC4766192.1 hypothetical protein [Methanosarcina sp. DH1]
MKRSLNRDVLPNKIQGNGLFMKREVKGEVRGENELKMISSGGVFR